MKRLLITICIFSIANTLIFLLILALSLVVKSDSKDHLDKLKSDNEDRKNEVRSLLKEIKK